MIPIEWIHALLGGGLIGLAASVLLVFNGRVSGISGILNGALHPKKNEFLWRFSFLVGLACGGLLLLSQNPSIFKARLSTPDWTLILAGVLVGFGTLMGNGCTSGHGVCGLSRLSLRSLAATCSFMLAGVLSIVLFRWLGVLA